MFTPSLTKLPKIWFTKSRSLTFGTKIGENFPSGLKLYRPFHCLYILRTRVYVLFVFIFRCGKNYQTRKASRFDEITNGRNSGLVGQCACVFRFPHRSGHWLVKVWVENSLPSFFQNLHICPVLDKITQTFKFQHISSKIRAVFL